MADTTFATVLPALKAVDNGDGTYSLAVSITGAGVTLVQVSESVLDDGVIALPVGSAGWGVVVVADNSHYIPFRWKSDGTVVLGLWESEADDVDDADTDTKFCIYNNAGTVTIKNRLGSVKLVTHATHRFTP